MTYVWMTWAADVLREAGVPVVEEPGWKTRGHSPSRYYWKPRYIVWHHDASPVGPSPGVAHWIANGTSSLPGPYSHFWVCRGCNGEHASGSWHVIAAGHAYHAGMGGPWQDVPADTMNQHGIGIETDETTGEAWDPAQRESLRRGTAALLKKIGAKPRPGLLFHRTWTDVTARTRHRKIDPYGMDIGVERDAVAAYMASKTPMPTPDPGPAPDPAPTPDPTPEPAPGPAGLTEAQFRELVAAVAEALRNGGAA